MNRAKDFKNCLVAATYSLVQVHAVNVPKFIKMLRNIGQKVIPKNSLDKFIIVKHPQDYFEYYLTELQDSCYNWMNRRGYLKMNN